MEHTSQFPMRKECDRAMTRCWTASSLSVPFIVKGEMPARVNSANQSRTPMRNARKGSKTLAFLHTVYPAHRVVWWAAVCLVG